MSEVVLITGATAGLGRKCANFLTEKGYKVYGTGRSVESGSKIDKFTAVKCDVLSDQSVESAIDFIIKKEGKIDIVINNAGRGMLGAAEDATIEECKALMDINFLGVIRVCQTILPLMRQAKKGKIINVSSLAGIMGLPYRSLYSASKYALEGWTESMRMEVKQFGIDVCLVSPGDFKSNIASGRIVSEDSYQSEYAQDFKKVEQKINASVDHGSDAELIVKSIYKAVKSNRPKLRYLAASPFQKFAVKLHFILPSSIFEKMMMKSSGIPKK